MKLFRCLAAAALLSAGGLNGLALAQGPLLASETESSVLEGRRIFDGRIQVVDAAAVVVADTGGQARPSAFAQLSAADKPRAWITADEHDSVGRKLGKSVMSPFVGPIIVAGGLASEAYRSNVPWGGKGTIGGAVMGIGGAIVGFVLGIFYGIFGFFNGGLPEGH